MHNPQPNLLPQSSYSLYATAFATIDQGFCLLEKVSTAAEQPVDFRYLHTNPAFEQQTGLHDVVGKTILEVGHQANARTTILLDQVMTTGVPDRFEVYAAPLDGWIQANAFRINQQPAQLAVLLTNTSEHKKGETSLPANQERSAFLLKLSDNLRAETSVEAVGHRATQLIAVQLGVDRVYLVTLNPNDDTVVVTHETRRQDLPPLQGSYRSSDFPAAIQEIFERTIVYDDVRTDDRLTDLDRLSFAGLGAVGFMAASLRRGSQTLIWAAGAVSTQPRFWTADEVVLFEDAVERTWAAIERVKTEEALRQSEEKFRTLFRSIDEGYALFEVMYDEQRKPVDLFHIETNPAYQQQSGLSDVVGRPFRELVPDLEPWWFEFYAGVARTGEAARAEYQVDALRRWYTVYASRVGGEGSHQVVAVFDDITERKRHEANLAFLADVNQDLAGLTDIDQTMNALGEKIAAHLHLSASAFAELHEGLHPGTLTAILSHGWHRSDVPSLLGTYRMDEFMTPEVMQLCLTGQAVVIRDVFEDPRTDGAQYAALHIGSFLSMPLVRDGQWRFLLVLYRSEAHDWSQDEVDLTRELTMRIWARLERARAEEALRESEEKFRLLSTASSDSLYTMNPDWTQMHQLMGKTFLADTTDSTSSWLQNYIPLEDQLPVQQVIREAIATKSTFELEHRVRRADGTVGWTFSRAVPVLDEQGAIREWLGAASDITARKVAEEALLANEERFRTLIQNLPDYAIFRIDPKGIITEWTDGAQRMKGYTAQEVIDQSIALFYTPEGLAAGELSTEMAQAAQAGRAERESVRIRKGGERFWVNEIMTAIHDGAGQLVGFTKISRDITERKVAERLIRDSQQRLQIVLDSIADHAIITTDPQGRITGWNPGAQQLFGHTAEEAIGQSLAIIFTTEDRATDQLEAELALARGQGRAPDERYHLRKDGSRLYVSGVLSPLYEADDELVGYVKVARDLTQRRGMEQALREADRRKDEFLAMLAHELRNPMSTIRSGLQILTLTDEHDQTTGPTVGRAASTVALMNRQTDQLVRLVDDLLDVSRISQGKIELKPQRVNLVEVVAQAAESLQVFFQEQGRRLHIDLPSAPIYVKGDGARLSQVVTNLLTNGARYTEEGGQVWLSLRHQAGMSRRSDRSAGAVRRGTVDHEPLNSQEALIQVRDNGIGLAADQLVSIFELFVQVDNSLARSKGGLGLGLTLVKRLVELHGGRVEARSEGIGKGSTFGVHLPTLIAAAEQVPNPTPSTTDGLTLQRILVVDDNADAAMTLGMLLKLKGYESHTRTSGRAGIEAAEQLRPAAMLLDIGMPDLDGYATCQLIRQQAWGQDLIVIALTGYGQQEDRKRTKEAGFDGHLVKPVDLAALTKLLTDLLVTE